MNRSFKQVCSCCGTATGPIFLDENFRLFCQKCFSRQTTVCCSCGNHLTHYYIISSLNGTSRLYCPKCKDHPLCSACHFPLKTGKAWKYDGDVFCRDCGNNLTDPDQAILKGITRNVYNFFRSKYGFSVRSPLPQVISAAQLRKLSQNSGEMTEMGFYSFESIIQRTFLFGNKTTSFKCQIYLRRGMVPATAEEVLAHEAGHDLWQSHLNCLDNQFYAEGFAQYMSFEYNNWCGRPERNIALLMDNDPIYGDGFRAVLSLAEQYSFKGLLRILKSKI